MKINLKTQAICIALFAIVFFNSCRTDETFVSEIIDGPKPTSTFTYNTVENNDLKIKFSNTSTNAETFHWQFGDGTSSTEESPIHTYATSGRYTAVLKVASASGYSAMISQEIIAASPATADFKVSIYGLQVQFANESAGVAAVRWDFGDSTEESTDISPYHEYTSPGTYDVTLHVTGIRGDMQSKTIQVNVDGLPNLIKGGNMEVGSDRFWSTWSVQNNNPPIWGYLQDKPTGGVDGCLFFPAFTTPANQSINQLIYQAVHVEAGKKYQFSAHVKLPSGIRLYFQVYLSEDPNIWREEPGGNHFLSLNAWHGWGSETATVAVDGEFTQLVAQFGNYGFGAATGGVYTATETKTLYLGIQAGSWNGSTNGQGFLLDNVAFAEIP